MNRRAILAALRAATGRGSGMLPSGAGAKKALRLRVNNIPKEALDNPGTWNPKTGYSELGPVMDRVSRRVKYMDSRAARPSVVDNEFSPSRRTSMRSDNRRLSANTKRYDEAYSKLEMQGLPDDEIRRRLKAMGL